MDKEPIRKAAFARFTQDLQSLPQLCSRKKQHAFIALKETVSA